MHELSIARAILDVVEREADGRRVHRVGVVVGDLRQVVPSALTFGFEVATDGTVAEGAELELEQVPAAGICRECGAETEMEGFPLSCADCGGFDMQVTRGEELRVDWLDLEEPEEPEAETPEQPAAATPEPAATTTREDP